MRRLFLLVSAVVFVDTAFYAAIAPLLPSYAADLGLSKTAAGVLTASYAAGTLVGSLPAGWLASRFGVKPTLLIGLGLMSVTSVVFGLANDIVLLDVTRFVQGVGGACSWAAGMAWLVSASPPERRGELIGSSLAAAIVGMLFGPVLGGAATVIGPEALFAGVAVVGARARELGLDDARGAARGGVERAQGRDRSAQAAGGGRLLALPPARALLRRPRGAGAAAP